MRGEQRRYRIRWAVATAWLACAALLTGCPGNSVIEDTIDGDQVGVDTYDVDTPETGDTGPEAIAYGEILLDVFPPEPFCGCSLSEIGWQSEGSLVCGWHLSDSFSFRVRAEHTALGLVGPDGVAQVKLWQHWPAGEDKKLSTLSNPEDGLFTFQLNASQLTLTEGNPDGNYWLRVEVVSAITGPDGLPMTRDLVIPLDVDTSGPAISVISPAADQKLSGSTTIVFTADDGAAASGVAALRVLHEKNPGQWEPLEAAFPVTEPNGKDTYVSSLDLSEFSTQDTTLRVEGEDCLGNVNFADVAVRIIAIPRFVTPSTLTVKDDDGARFDRIQAVQGDSLTGYDPEEPPLDLLVTGNHGVHVAWGHPDGTFDAPVLVVSAPEAIDSRFQDITGDGVPDLIVLAPEADQEERVVALWIQGAEPGTKPKGKRTFQLKEKRNVQLFPNKLDIADVTGDYRPDILVVSIEENESLNVLHHTGKTAGVPGDPSAYLDYPETFTGVTGGVDIGHADVNNDGFVDVLIGREGSSWFTVYVNDGNGAFPIGVDSLVGFGNGLTHILVAHLHDNDFDPTPLPDVIVFNKDLKTLMMLENTGNGYFEHPGLLPGEDMETWGNRLSGSQIQAKALEWSDEIESGRMVVVGTDIGGLVRGNFDGDDIPDLAVTSSEEKLVRIYRGDPPPEPGINDNPDAPQFHFLGNFHQERFLNAGERPGDLASGDFNGDGMDDLAVLNGDTANITLLMSKDGNYQATIEIPMPVKPKWNEGQLVPTMALVADFGAPKKYGSHYPDGRQDLVVITEPVIQAWIFPPVEEGGEEEEQDISVPLLFTYLGLAQPDGSDFAPIKSAISHRMSNEISGAAVGHFDGDKYPDIAVCTETDPGDIADSGNFDILRGAKNPLTSTPSDAEVENHFPGRFWPLGGFIGPRNPTDIATAQLNEDELDDVVLVAPQVGTLGSLEMQFAHAVAYITRFDMSWNSCTDSYKQVSFECCQPIDPALPCGPMVDDNCELDEEGEENPQTINRCYGPETADNTVGVEPIKVLVDFISYTLGELDEIPDVITLNRGSANFSYFQGALSNDNYFFQNLVDYPNIHPIGSLPVDIDVGDLDDDGLPDLVAALQSSLVIAYGLDAEWHNFELGVPLEKGPDAQNMAPTGVLMADVNRDGYVDIVTSSTSKSRIWIYVSGGDRDFLGPYPFECGKDPVDVVEIHFEEVEEDIPPIPHLAVVNAGSRSISILRNEHCD